MSRSSDPKPLAGERVLIVEDRYLIAADMAAHVEELGGRVLGPARSVPRAQAIMASNRADIALLDVNLSDEDVLPLVEELADRGVPFIFVTGYNRDALPDAWRDRPCLPKPVDPRALRDALTKLRPEVEGATKGCGPT